ncbi:hypothetical protein BBK82_08840 [Lentzea guizhouensis]|uniref:Histidine kinase/HSP90-like ATPase domain-containing protein n=1 Tax=Lentzea guizhouensis TaxID=1586287 RepID=A0A1B2HEL5_9PSEU|nr:ATP-binding protein [Lentzea guizhouensis]ANZ36156.1 hypothetical protein BBK82_08840 [Lentzea guizhouensis]
MTDNLMTTLLAEWPARRRYPALVSDLSSGTLTADTAARHVLAGLARPRTPAQNLTDLIAEGRFEQAELLLIELLDSESESGASLSADEWSRAESMLAESRERAVAALSREWSDLLLRAQAVAVDLPPDTDLLDTARQSLSRAREEIDDHSGRVKDGERDVRRRIESALTAALSAVDRAPATRAWEAAVRECLSVGELRVAERLVADGPHHIAQAGPHTIPRPPLTWPWPNRPVAEVLSWYDSPFSMPGPEFVRFRLDQGDIAAFKLINLLKRMVEGVDAAAVRDFATSLSALLGKPVSLEVNVAEGKSGFLTTLFGLSDPRLPDLPMLGSRGVPLWVSDETTDGDSTPPASDTPIIWFRPVLIAPSPPAASNVAVFDVATLLRVIAPDGRNGTAIRNEQGINLLRLLIPQLSPAAVLGDAPAVLGRGASPRDSLAWYFDLFGVLPDGPVLDSLLQDSDEHPIVLNELLTVLLRHRPADKRIRSAQLAVTRTAEVRSAARTRVLQTLADLPAAKAVLMLLLWRFDDVELVRADEVADSIPTVELPPGTTSWLRERLPVQRALEALAARGFVRARTKDRFALPGPGLRDLLRGVDGPRKLRDDLVLALNEAAEKLRQTRFSTAALIAERVIRLIGHHVDNDVIAITGMLDRALESVAEPSVQSSIRSATDRLSGFGGGSYVQAYEAALAQPEALEVHDLIRTVIGDVEWHLPAGARIADISQSIEQAKWIRINRYVMQEILRSLVLNAARALNSSAPQENGLVAFHVRQEDMGPQSQPRAAQAHVVIEVHDNGPGFSPDELELYRRITTQGGAAYDPRTMTRHGSGIRQAVTWLADFHGALELHDHSQRFGGGRVSIWLPADQAPSAGGTP